MDPIETPSQVTYPWRAVVRTVFALVIALSAGAPLLYAAAANGNAEAATGVVGAILGVAAGVTRVMALPTTNELIDRFLPWLSATADAPLER